MPQFTVRTLLFCFSLTVSGQNLPSISQDSANNELVQYVRDAKKAGLRPADIQKNALNSGWPASAVDRAMESVLGPATNPSSGSPEKTPVNSSGDGKGPLESKAAEPEKVPAREPASNPKALLPDSPGSTAPITIPGAAGARDEYRIGEGDVLGVSVWGEPAASVTSVVVRPDGMISMPLIKDVHVAGLTPGEVEKAVTTLLEKHIKAADVTVIVSEINSKKVFVVGGGVKKEGPIAYTYRMTVMQALSEAGGLTDYAKRKKIYTLRRENGREYKLAFDYDAVLKGQHMELNIPLLPGDTLVVPNH
jgi:polysaccharide export outer membrane protein